MVGHGPSSGQRETPGKGLGFFEVFPCGKLYQLVSDNNRSHGPGVSSTVDAGPNATCFKTRSSSRKVRRVPTFSGRLV